MKPRIANHSCISDAFLGVTQEWRMEEALHIAALNEQDLANVLEEEASHEKFRIQMSTAHSYGRRNLVHTRAFRKG